VSAAQALATELAGAEGTINRSDFLSRSPARATEYAGLLAEGLGQLLASAGDDEEQEPEEEEEEPDEEGEAGVLDKAAWGLLPCGGGALTVAAACWWWGANDLQSTATRAHGRSLGLRSERGRPCWAGTRRAGTRATGSPTSWRNPGGRSRRRSGRQPSCWATTSTAGTCATSRGRRRRGGRRGRRGGGTPPM
jgi:hypothetical protein